MPMTSGGDGWLSVVFEVGCSLALPTLPDARWWLSNSFSKTRMAIRITENPFSLAGVLGNNA